MSENSEKDKGPQIAKTNALLDIIFKIGTPLGLLLVAWMGTQFASKEEVDTLQSKVSEIEKVLAVMVETNRVNERQDKDIADHEARIRSLENK